MSYIAPRDFHVTSNVCNVEHMKVVDGTYDPGDDANPGYCQTISASKDPWLDINYLDSQNFTSVYVMGSNNTATQDDLSGVNLYVIKMVEGAYDSYMVK